MGIKFLIDFVRVTTVYNVAGITGYVPFREYRKKRLLDKDSVYDAVLTGSAHNASAAYLSLDNGSLGKEITPDIVRVCCVCFYILNFCFLCHTGCGVAD